MKRIFTILLLAAFFINLSIANPDSRPKNVVIYGRDMKSQGSGVITDKGILTAAHVVGHWASVYVRYYGTKRLEIEVVKKRDKKKDLALLSCLQKDVPHSEFANSEPLIGDRVYMIGSGWDHFWSLKYGTVSNIEGRHLILDMSVYPGDSGSPVYNSQDEIVGIVRAVDIVFSGVGQGYAVKLSEIQEFLK